MNSTLERILRPIVARSLREWPFCRKCQKPFPISDCVISHGPPGPTQCAVDFKCIAARHEATHVFDITESEAEKIWKGQMTPAVCEQCKPESIPPWAHRMFDCAACGKRVRSSQAAPWTPDRSRE